MTHGTIITRTALAIFKNKKASLERAFASYDQEVEEDYKAGHRSHYCFHGMNQWTDYDNICGACEDGLTMLEDYLPIIRREALNQAANIWDGLKKIQEVAKTMRDMGLTFDFDKAFDELMTKNEMPR